MQKNNKGFSLIELIIVIAIIAVLIGILVPEFLKYVEKSKRQADLATVREIFNVINLLNTEYVTFNYIDLIYVNGYCSFEFSKKAYVDAYGSEEAFYEGINSVAIPEGKRFFMVDFFNMCGTIPESKLGEEYAWAILFDAENGIPVFAGLYNTEVPDKHYFLYPDATNFLNGISVTNSEFQNKIQDIIN